MPEMPKAATKMFAARWWCFGTSPFLDPSGVSHNMVIDFVANEGSPNQEADNSWEFDLEEPPERIAVVCLGVSRRFFQTMKEFLDDHPEVLE